MFLYSLDKKIILKDKIKIGCQFLLVKWLKVKVFFFYLEKTAEKTKTTQNSYKLR